MHRYGQFFAGGVFFLSFADLAGVPAEVAACGVGLKLPEYADLKLDEQVMQVTQAWQQPIPRLLIFDNCEDETLLAQWKPTSGGCQVLVTSRRAEWDLSLGVVALPLDVLPRAKSIALLRKFRPDLAQDDADLDAVAGELGDLPLALHLAGSFLKRYRHAMSLAAYLQQLRSPALLRHPSMQSGERSPTGHELHVARTFALSYDKLGAANVRDVLAIALLARAACFAPGQPIPHALLLATIPTPFQPKQGFWARVRGWLRLGQRQAPQFQVTALELEDALARLMGLGLLEAEYSVNKVFLHFATKSGRVAV